MSGRLMPSSLWLKYASHVMHFYVIVVGVVAVRFIYLFFLIRGEQQGAVFVYTFPSLESHIHTQFTCIKWIFCKQSVSRMRTYVG